MTIEDQIRDEKLQYDINREAAKISALSSGKIHKYDYLTEQAKFTYSPLAKAFEKQTKTIEDQREKQIKAYEDKTAIKSFEKFTYNINDSPMVLKEKKYLINSQRSFEKTKS